MVGCALVAAGFLLLRLGDVLDPVQMPTSPALLAAGAALAAALLIGASARSSAAPRPAHLLVIALAAATMLTGSLFALPHTVLMAVAWVGAALTGGTGPFQVEPSWPSTAVHLTNLLATGAVLAWLLPQYRRATRRCVVCGRQPGDPPTDATTAQAPWWQRLRVLAAVAIVVSLPYAAFKVAWSAGAQVGLVGAGFQDVSFTSPGFGDTALMTGISIAVCLVMGSGLTASTAARRAVRLVALGIGTLGSLMLLPAGAVAIAMLVPVALGRASIDDSLIAPWAFTVIYVSFVLWGVALAALTLRYRSATRPPCSHPGQAGSSPGPRGRYPGARPIAASNE